MTELERPRRDDRLGADLDFGLRWLGAHEELVIERLELEAQRLLTGDRRDGAQLGGIARGLHRDVGGLTDRQLDAQRRHADVLLADRHLRATRHGAELDLHGDGGRGRDRRYDCARAALRVLRALHCRRTRGRCGACVGRRGRCFGSERRLGFSCGSGGGCTLQLGLLRRLCDQHALVIDVAADPAQQHQHGEDQRQRGALLGWGRLGERDRGRP